MTKRDTTVGELLKRARQKQGRSMQQVADDIGITKSLLGAWELDQVAQPDPSRLTRLAGVLEIDANTLLKAAGYDLDAALPAMQPYLRSKYKHLPPQARSEIQTAFERISSKYGIDPTGTGPGPGQDE